MRRKNDGVNKRVGVRRGRIWLPESYTDPNSRIENFCETTFSGVLTSSDISDVCPEMDASNDKKRVSDGFPKHGFTTFSLKIP
jgi:hypothetical protein